MNVKNYIYGFLCLVLCASVGAALWYKGGVGEVTTTPEATSTVLHITDISTTTKVNGYTIEPVYSKAPAAKSITIPDYAKPMLYASSVSAEVKNAIEAQHKDVVTALRKSTEDFNSWMQLGTLYKMAGDYQSAVVVWTYVTKNWPGVDFPYGNLGDLYQNFLKDYPKAEANYKTAIAIRPKNSSYYQSLYLLYRDQYTTSPSAAADILEQGLKANPGDQTLLDLQKQLKK